MNRPVQRLVMPSQIGQGLTAPPQDPRYHMWRSEPNIHVAAQQQTRNVQQQQHQHLQAPPPAHQGPRITNNPQLEGNFHGNFHGGGSEHNFESIVSMPNQFQGNQQINYNYQTQPSHRQSSNHGSVVSN